MENLDLIDRKILAILQDQGRITNAQLAKELSLSPSPTLERVKKLEQSGVIRQYVALVDERKINRNTTAFVTIALERLSDTIINTFNEEVITLPEVMECYSVAGDNDYMMKVVVSDLDEYNIFLHEKLAKVNGIRNIKTSFVLTAHKRETALPVSANSKSGKSGRRKSRKKV